MNKHTNPKDYLSNKPGLLTVLAYSLLFLTLSIANTYITVDAWQNSLSELISIILAGAFFLVYLTVSQADSSKRPWSWLAVIVASLIMALFVWSNGALSWLWFSPLYAAYHIPQILGTDALSAFIIFFAELIICSLCFTLVTCRLIKTTQTKSQLKANALFLLLSSLVLSVILTAAAIISTTVSMPYPLYVALTVLPQAIAIGLLFHLIYVRVKEPIPLL